MLTGEGEQKALTAQYYDTEGRPIDAEITWTSSDPAAISVDETGRVTARRASGSTQIFATANGVSSPPIPAIVAQPAAGAELVTDDQVLAGPELVDPGAPLEVGLRYRVRLRDSVPVSPGTLLVPTESVPVAGRVVESAPVAGGNDVVVEVVPLTELFRTLSINQRVDLQLVESAFTDEALAAPNEVQGDGGAASGFVFQLGPFECKAELMPQLTGSLIEIDVSQALFVEFQVEIQGGTLQRLRVKLDGSVTGSVRAGLFLTAAFNGSIRCKATLKEIKVPVPAPVAVVFGPVVPIGLGLDIEGSLQLDLLELGIQGETGVVMELGFDYQADSGFVGFDRFEPSAEFHFVSEIPEDLIDSLRLDAGVYPHAFAELASTGVVGAVLGEIADSGSSFGLVASSFGARLGGNLATAEGQASDPEYASSYDLKLLAQAGLGEDLDELFKLFDAVDVTVADVSASTELILARSPRGTLSASNSSTLVEDEVTFTVELDPAHVDYPVIGYRGIPRVPLELASDTRTTVTVRPRDPAPYATEAHNDVVFRFDVPRTNCQDHAEVNVVDGHGTRRAVIDGTEEGFVGELFAQDILANTVSPQVEASGRSVVFVKEPGARIQLQVRGDVSVAGGVVGPDGTIDADVGVYEISALSPRQWQLIAYVTISSGSEGVSTSEFRCDRPGDCDVVVDHDTWPGVVTLTSTLPAGQADILVVAHFLSDAFTGRTVTSDFTVTLGPAPGSEGDLIFATPVEPGICRPFEIQD